MKIFLDQNVYDAGLDRVRRVFDEFENVGVWFSGGKDSTICLELALIVARERDRLPLKVCFLDQEAEWDMVIDYVKEVMYREEIEPVWVQVPIFLPNAISQEDKFLISWEPGKEWMREKDPVSIKEGFDLKEEEGRIAKSGYWYTYFDKTVNLLYPDSPACFIGGMRAEESPKRVGAVTSNATYKDITWGKKLNERKGHYTFYPIYDWTIVDVWKAIHDNDWKYCKVYDEFYRHGVSVRDMRVSNLHHESAVKMLYYVHEIESDTWNRLTKRLGGVNQAKHISEKELLSVKDLPFMFKTWKEYRDYLTENLITNKKNLLEFRKKWAAMDIFYDELRDPEVLHRGQIKSVLVNDNEFAKLTSMTSNPIFITYSKWKTNKPIQMDFEPQNLKQIKPEHIERMRRDREINIGGG